MVQPLKMSSVMRGTEKAGCLHYEIPTKTSKARERKDAKRSNDKTRFRNGYTKVEHNHGQQTCKTKSDTTNVILRKWNDTWD